MPARRTASLPHAAMVVYSPRRSRRPSIGQNHQANRRATQHGRRRQSLL